MRKAFYFVSQILININSIMLYLIPHSLRRRVYHTRETTRDRANFFCLHKKGNETFSPPHVYNHSTLPSGLMYPPSTLVVPISGIITAMRSFTSKPVNNESNFMLIR